MEGAMLVKISSQISPNSTRFGVNIELSAKDTRSGNNLGKKHCDLQQSKKCHSQLWRNFKRNSLFTFEPCCRGRSLKIWLKHFQLPCIKKKFFNKKVDSLLVEIKHFKRENYEINKRQKGKHFATYWHICTTFIMFSMQLEWINVIFF